jgi:vancomycin resistance protein VanW
MVPQSVAEPQKRSLLRKYVGREFFILKRRMNWMMASRKYAAKRQKNSLPHLQFTHQSLLLRPLKNVDMVLQHNKITNLRLAISNIDGVVIEPGQTFSIWKMVGRPTRPKGYLDGLVLENGMIKRGTGGGLCQLGNLLYWMALHSPLVVTERWRHSFDVFPDLNRTIPFACGATLSYNYVDLQLHNPTDQPFQIRLWLDDAFLNGELWSDRQPFYHFEVFETDHMIKHQWWGGYTRHNKISKKIIRLSDGSETIEPVSENHAIMMYNPILENR